MVKNDINNNVLPNAMPSSYTFNINFALGNPYVIDLKKDLSMNAISKTIQSIWIDNSNNSSLLTISVLETQQNINIPGLTQSIYPLFLPHNGGQISISSPNNSAQVIIILFDIPTDFISNSIIANLNNINIAEISTSQSLNVVPINSISTPLFTSPANSINENVNIAAQNIALINNPVLTTQQILSSTITSAIPAATAETLIAAQTAPNLLSISNILVNMSPNTTLAAAGLETISFKDTNGDSLFSLNLYIPAAAGTIPTIINIPGFIVNTNYGLEYEISTVLAAGNIDLIINYNITTL